MGERKLATAQSGVKVKQRLDIGARRPLASAFATTAKSCIFLETSVPNIASAKKNMRKSRAAQARNRAQRSALRTALKKAKIEGASAEERARAITLLDRSARKGLIHKNAAARQKSKLAKAANARAAT